MTPRAQRGGIKKQTVERELREALTALARRARQGGFGGSSRKYQLVLASENGQALAEHARKVERELRTIPGIGNVTSTSSLVRPELIVRPDFARAADLGVTSAAIADTLRIATAGDYDQGLAKLNLAQRQVPIVVKLPPGARQDMALLERLAVPGARGPVMLGNVATLTIDSGPAQIDRYDRLRNINFEIELNQQPLGAVQAEALALPSLQHLPPGVTQTTVGDAEAMTELFASFGLAMLTGVLCIYIVLVLLFKDFVQPVTILAALVLSIPAPSSALFLTHTGAVDAVDDRPDHADGHRHQELDPAGRVRDRGAARPRHEPHRGAARCLPQARPADRDDHHRDGRRHAADRARHRHRPELSLADGDRRDRRPDHLDLPQPAGDPGGVHLCDRIGRRGVFPSCPAGPGSVGSSPANKNGAHRPDVFRSAVAV